MKQENKTDLSFSALFAMQNELYEKHDWWLERSPENGHKKLLWMFEELGEVISIIKKKGSSGILEDSGIRKDFVEECSDVLAYYLDMLSCYGVSAQEISEAFIRKYEKNKTREFTKHNKYHEQPDASLLK